jgi:hypothetical protein
MYCNEGESHFYVILTTYLFFGAVMRNEATYQAGLIKRLRNMFPGCHVQKNDPAENQGAPDLLILFRDRWAMLEVKASASAPTRPNQPYHVDKFNEMSFAAIIYPENEDEVLHELQASFGAVC